MEVVDSRRLTGPNLVWERPGAVIDVRLDEAHAARVIGAWRAAASRMLAAIGWDAQATCVHRYPGAASLALSAPRDALYAATEINDWAWAAATDADPPTFESEAVRLRALIEDEANPALGALESAARRRGLPFLPDDDAVSIGFGAGSRTWPANALPSPEAAGLDVLRAVPVGLVTGTNGKTTSVRIAAAIARAAGHVAGVSSTDWIAVGDEILDRGDYSGPVGARAVLRDPRVTLAILETARGGLQRRGLAVERADAALVTNVAADHLGDFGVPDVRALGDVKWTVTRALDANGRLVLNADDPQLVERSTASPAPITWYSTDAGNAVLGAHLDAGGDGLTLDDGLLIACIGGTREIIAPVADVPLTLAGTAVHNVSNVLGAAGLALALGIGLRAVAAGLAGMRGDDNPGRANLYRVGDATVLVDFAHNPHGVAAVADTARRMNASRTLLVIGQAGDRDDESIREMVRAAWALAPAAVFVKEMAHYRRGRAAGEVQRLIAGELHRLGAPAASVHLADSELDAVRAALDAARPGDLLVALTHEDATAVDRLLRQRR